MSSIEMIIKRRPSRPQVHSESPPAAAYPDESHAGHHAGQHRVVECHAKPANSAEAQHPATLAEEEAHNHLFHHDGHDHHEDEYHHHHDYYDHSAEQQEADAQHPATLAEEEAHDHLFHHDKDGYHEDEHHHHHEYYNHPAEQEEEAAHGRHTCAPSSVPPPHHADAQPDSDVVSAPFDESVEEDEQQREDAAAPVPPPAVKTARPKDTKGKKAKAKKTKKTKKENSAASASPAAPASTPAAAPKKKKPTRRVNIANVEKQPPLPEGVNTPRSVAVCQQHGVNPSELAPYPKEHFQGPGVDPEVAELRYHSYEKRRQARMEELKPAYQRAARRSGSRQGDDKRAAAPVARAGGEPQPHADNADAEERQQPTVQPTDEEEAMHRQFEAQHQRLMEQERRKASGSAYDGDGHRRSAPCGTSPRAGAGPTSPGRYSITTSALGRPTVDQPYSAVKIYSHSISEARPLTQSEAVMIDDINEREARRLDTQERAVIIQENKQLMYVERELEKQRRATANVQEKALARERRQKEAAQHSNDRLNEAAARRQRLEEERQARLLESIEEKEGRVHANDPYASLLSRRRYSGSMPRAGTSSASAPHDDEEEEQEHHEMPPQHQEEEHTAEAVEAEEL